MAGVSSVMCSYSELEITLVLRLRYHLTGDLDLINDTYACNNNKTMNDILKREFGFQGCKYWIAD
jgi:beta-glucosidase